MKLMDYLNDGKLQWRSLTAMNGTEELENWREMLRLKKREERKKKEEKKRKRRDVALAGFYLYGEKGVYVEEI